MELTAPSFNVWFVSASLNSALTMSWSNSQPLASSCHLVQSLPDNRRMCPRRPDCGYFHPRRWSSGFPGRGWHALLDAIWIPTLPLYHGDHKSLPIPSIYILLFKNCLERNHETEDLRHHSSRRRPSDDTCLLAVKSLTRASPEQWCLKQSRWTHPSPFPPCSAEGGNTQKDCPKIAGRLTVCQLDETSMIFFFR